MLSDAQIPLWGGGGGGGGGHIVIASVHVCVCVCVCVPNTVYDDSPWSICAPTTLEL